jgi:predicted nucleic acid-binding protein
VAELLLVDTDILIDVARGVEQAILCLKRLEEGSVLAISIVTHMELIVGCRNKTELKDLEFFLQRFQVLKLTESISEKTVELLTHYRLSHGLLIPDALIAATALIHKVPLLSKNQKDYRFLSELQLLPYP